MSRLDRLVSLLDTGFSSYIRNVAAEQIADVQKSRPEELFNLLGRVTPFLQSPKWDTRIAAAKAIGLIAENTVWDPSEPIADEQVGHVKNEALDFPLEEENSWLTFDQLDISTVIFKGTPLLGSAGREYDHAIQTMDSEHRLKLQRQSLKRKIGMEFLNDDDAKELLDTELESSQRTPSSGPILRRSRSAVKLEIKPEDSAEIKAANEEQSTKEPVNARLRALAKRKARFGSPQPPPFKARAVESPSASKTDQHSDTLKEKVVVQYKDEAADEANLLVVKDPRVFPFELLYYRLLYDMFEPTWEVRHGALLCLREIIRVHGKVAGMIKGLSEEANKRRNTSWLEDLACRLCCIFALDRFADYVADQAVAPVRESCAQTLGALILNVPLQIAHDTFEALYTLILDPESTGAWAACHGGMLGMRYFVSLRLQLIVDNDEMFSKLVNCVFKGLNNMDDDEVQAIAAAVLLPIASEFVERRPNADICNLLKILWECISDLKDELSTSVGNVMDLLATLCTYPKVLEALVSSDTKSSLAELVPHLYPFLRHSIIDVRKAVLRSLKTFLSLEFGSKDWVSLVTLRLVFQNILLEQNDGVVDLSMDLWRMLMDFLNSLESKKELLTIFAQVWASTFPLLMTPIGSARRFYKMDDNLLVKPSGESYADATPASASSSSKLEVNIDGPMILGDTLIFETSTFIRARVNGAIALGCLTSICIDKQNSIPQFVLDDLETMFLSPMSSQHLTIGLLLEEIGKSSPQNSEPLDFLAQLINPWLEKSMDPKGPAILWRDINPILRAVRTQCQSLFSLLLSQNELCDTMVPKLPTSIEGDPNTSNVEVFTLTQARTLATETFYKLKSQLSPETQVRMSEILEDGRKNLVHSIEEAESSLENRNTSIRAASAAAYINLNQGKLPSKLNPIIRGLMDEIKTENIPLLHERASSVLSNLINDLIRMGRGPAGTKIVKNLCGFLCVDIHEAPEFDESEQNIILSLKKDDIKMDSKNISEILNKERENRVAFIKRQGAILTLSKLSKLYGKDLFKMLPEIETQIFSTILSQDDTANSSKHGQALIDSLAILRTLLPFLHPTLYSAVANALPAISKALYSKFSVVRHVASRCMAITCKVMPSIGITFVVKEILGKSLVDQSSVTHRQGSIEAIFHMMLAMGEEILPYLVFFIVPVLGRMSDSDQEIRLIAATTFASIIKLVPLESGIEDPHDVPSDLLEGKEREREFIGQMMDPSRIQEFSLPVAVNAQLRRYQQEGINWLAFLNKYHLHGILCDDMGLGKTLQTICMVASDHVLRAEEHAQTKSSESRRLPSLIICPTTLTSHWVEEINKYVPSLKVQTLLGLPKVRQAMLDSGKLKKADVVVTSYDTARNEVGRLAGDYEWNYCVLDEGHIVKNAASKLSKAIKQYRACHRLVLTGTPIQNNVLELWSLFDFLMPGFLGNEKSFNERFAKPIAVRSSGKASPKDQEAATLALEALHKQVLPFTLRRLKEDVLDDLPPKIIQDYYCDLNETQRALYDNFAKQQKAVIEHDAAEAMTDRVTRNQGDQARKHIFQALQYMRKLCNHPSFVKYTKSELATKWPLKAEQSPKLMALQQLLRDCGIGTMNNLLDGVPGVMSQHRALIFCQQREMLDLVQKSLFQEKMPSISYLRMDGSTPGPQRQKLVSKFNDDPSIDVLLLTTHVGGLGLNLTGADTVIFVEHDWNPMNDLQAMDRAHRLGQKRVVNVYRLITRDTLEERIMGLQQFKMNIASSVINQQNKGLTSMGTDQILDLFSTSADYDSSSANKSIEDAAGRVDPNTGKLLGKKAEATVGLGDLWDESEYAEEYDLDKFIKSLQKK